MPELGEQDYDPHLLMWDVQRNVDALPPGRTVLQFSFRDVPPGLRNWWLVLSQESVDLRDFDPGQPVGRPDRPPASPFHPSGARRCRLGEGAPVRGAQGGRSRCRAAKSSTLAHPVRLRDGRATWRLGPGRADRVRLRGGPAGEFAGVRLLGVVMDRW